jgi:hypothetical protein
VAVLGDTTVQVYDSAGGRVHASTSPGDVRTASASKDGRHVLVGFGDESQPSWALLDVTTGRLQRLAGLDGTNVSAGPQGTRYRLFVKGRSTAVVRAGAALDTYTGTVRNIELPAGGGIVSGITADGSRLVVSVATTTASSYAVSAVDGTVTPIAGSRGSVTSSPDGTRLFILQGRKLPGRITDAAGRTVAEVPAGLPAWTAGP